MGDEKRRDGTEVNDTFESEFAQDVAPDLYHTRDNERDGVNRTENTGTGFGITGIVFSILAFFLWPYLMAPIGIILGVVAVTRQSSTGWWAIGIGVLALVLITIFMIFAIPFRILF